MATVFELGTTGTSRDKWISLLDRLPTGLRDIHYHPDYMRIYEMTYGDRAVLLVHEQNQGLVFQPFIVRKIVDDDRYDVTSVYGHGGPLAAGDVDALAFQNALADWFSKNEFVSEYCLLSPFEAPTQIELLADTTCATHRKDVVVADLSQDVHVLWGNMEERQRKSCAIARRQGVVIEHSTLTDDDFMDFQRGYLAT